MKQQNRYNRVDLNDSLKNGVTIGIPLYNEDEFIETAIHSAAPQCEVLLISDNNSSDKSEFICKKLAKIYPNLHYVRHPHNMGAAKNFEYVMRCATTEYFMWLGAHDYISTDYVYKLTRKIMSDPEGLMAYGGVRHVNREGEETSVYSYFYSGQLSDDEPYVRLMAIIRYLNDCSLIHGIFITERLMSLWEDFNYLAADHVLLAKAALAGKLLCEPDAFLYRRSVHLNDSSSDQLKRITGASQKQLIILKKVKMQSAQYDLACKEFQKMGWKACFYNLKCRFFLVSRFGSFSKNSAISSLEFLIWSISRIYRVIIIGLRGIFSYSQKTKV